MLFNDRILISTLFTTIISFLPIETSLEITDTSHRSRRQLLFPNSTLLQCNFGMAIPTPDKGIIVNWAIQTNFQLPWNRSQIPVDIFEANSGYVGTARKKRDLDLQYRNNAKLYHFYKAIEDIVTGFGHNGQGCVLRTLCQLGAEPLHTTGEDDLLHEIATYVLNPLNDIEDGVSEESMPYIEALQHGRQHKNCIKIYDNCSLSLIDLFTMLH